MNELSEKELKELKMYAWSFYIIYLITLIITPILSFFIDIPSSVIIGAQIGSIVIAYTGLNRANRREPNHYLVSHFRWQIKTFWILLIYSIVAVVIIILFGIISNFESELLYLVLIAILIPIYIWCLYRIIKGILYLKNHKNILVKNL